MQEHTHMLESSAVSWVMGKKEAEGKLAEGSKERKRTVSGLTSSAALGTVL